MKQIATLNTKSDAIRSFSLFNWTLNDEKDLGNNKYCLYFSRDDSIENIEEIRKLEKEYFKVSIVPYWLIIALLVVAFVLVTLFGTLVITKTINLDSIPQTILIVVPTGLVLILVVILTRIRFKGLKKYFADADKRYLEYKKKMEDLNSGK